MRLRKYGISLERLRAEDLELVRQMRNSGHIRERMQFTDHISRAQQQQWFRSIDNRRNYYFTIRHEGRSVGLINGKDVDFDRGTSEGGLFIWERALWDTAIPAMASLMLTDLTFYFVGLRKTYIEVLRSNTKAIAYNHSLGFRPTPDRTSTGAVAWYELTQEAYEQKAERLRAGLESLTGDGRPLDLVNIDLDQASMGEIERLYRGFASSVQAKLEIIIGKRIRGFE